MKIKVLALFAFILFSCFSCKRNDAAAKPSATEKAEHEISDPEVDHKELEQSLAFTNKMWDSLNVQLRNKELSPAQKDSLQQLFNSNREVQENIYKDFIREHSNSMLAVENLNGFKFTWGKDTTEALFESLDPVIQKTEEGELIEEYIAYYRDPEVGDSYSDFELPNLEGEQVTLSDELKDYTLLEFWASWCGACRKKHPELIKLYEEYKDKGFNILGISSDAAAADWKTSVEKDELPWVNLRDPNGRESTVQYQYGIHIIPTNFLIGPDGTIVAKNMNPQELGHFLEKTIKTKI